MFVDTLLDAMTESYHAAVDARVWEHLYALFQSKEGQSDTRCSAEHFPIGRGNAGGVRNFTRERGLHQATSVTV